MKALNRIVTLYLLLQIVAKCDKIEIIDVVKDALLALQCPLRVTTSLCWSRNDYVNLATTLMQNGFLVTPSKGELTTYWPHEQQLFLIDMSCDNSNDTLANAIAQNLLDPPFKWFILDQIQKPSTLELSVSSKVYFFNKTSPGTYHIVSKYKISKKSDSYQTNDIAVWTMGRFVYYNTLSPARNRTNLQGLTLNATIIIDKEQKKHLLDGKSRHINSATKINYPLTLHVLDSVNASGNFIDRVEHSYEREELVEVMDDLQGRNVDLCATPLLLTADRLRHAEGIALTTPSRTRFIFKAPPLSVVGNVYVLPFDTYVWISSLALVTIAPIVFYIISYWEQKSAAFNHYEKPRNSVSRLNPTPINLLQLQIGAIFQQGSEAEPISASGRLATIFLFVSTLFIFTSYAANIVGLLQSTSDGIRTAEHLLEYKIELGVENTTYNRYIFSNQIPELQKAVYSQKIAPVGKQPHFMDFNSGVVRMRDEFFAIHADTSCVYKIVSDSFYEHEKCALREINFLHLHPPVYVIRKNSTYGELFKTAMRKIVASGLAVRSFKRIYTRKPPCIMSGGTFVNVSLNDCYGAVVVFGVGLLLSILFLLIEIVLFKQFNK